MNQIELPAAPTEVDEHLGVSWTQHIGEYDVRVTWPRATKFLMLSIRHGGQWRSAGQLPEEHWNHDGTREGARERALHFFEADQIPEDNPVQPNRAARRLAARSARR